MQSILRRQLGPKLSFGGAACGPPLRRATCGGSARHWTWVLLGEQNLLKLSLNHFWSCHHIGSKSKAVIYGSNLGSVSDALRWRRMKRA